MQNPWIPERGLYELEGGRVGDSRALSSLCGAPGFAELLLI
jgi:hypothetical protein